MAEYIELYDVRANTTLMNRLTVASMISAQRLIDKVTPTVDEINFATDVLANPDNTAGSVMNYVIGKNNTSSISQILTASDTVLQSQVDTAIDAIIAGDPGSG